MPVYRHSVTGNEATLDSETVTAYAPGVWTLVADESPDEIQARLDADNTAKFEQDKADVEEQVRGSHSAAETVDGGVSA